MQVNSGTQGEDQDSKPKPSPTSPSAVISSQAQSQQHNGSTSLGDRESLSSPQVSTASITAPANPRKRLYATRVTQPAFPRKRAPAACELCRSRKTKCDNARPSCGCCTTLNAQCIYHDTQPAAVQFDPASLSILKKLDHITSLLESGKDQSHLRDVFLRQDRSNSLTSAPSQNDRLPKTPNSVQAPPPDREVDSDSVLKIPSSSMSPDNILAWPVFNSQFGHSFLNARLYKYYTSISTGDEATSVAAQESFNTLSSAHIAEIPRLVESFLLNVHTKNPFLDIDTLRAEAQRVNRCGLDWTGWTCIVLLASALGSVSNPFGQSRHDMMALSHAKYNSSSTSIFFSRSELSTATIYYHHARQRIGLLNANLVAIQCYLVSGIYHMYLIKPIEAWNDFSQACGRFWLLLQGSRRNPQPGDGVADHTCLRNALEQRLYWSCFKSESELRNQLELPPSSIADLAYPDQFPSPPVSNNTTEDNERQKSWFYYTTDISMRRTGNSILNTFYTTIPSAWLDSDIDKLLSIADEFESQLAQTHECLPECLQYSYTNLSSFPSNELAFSIRGRVLGILASLYYPFLYIVIHSPSPPSPLTTDSAILHPTTSRHSPLPARVHHLAQKAMDISLHIMRGFSIRHRHHGLWFSARQCTAAGLAVIAAAKSGRVSIPEDSRWRDMVETAIADLQWWRAESMDIGRGADVLRGALGG